MLNMGSRCWLCHSTLTLAHQGVCSYCVSYFIRSKRYCPRCGLLSSSTDLPCGRCIKTPPYWHSLVAVGEYASPLGRLLNQYKLQKRIELTYPLARLMFLAWYNAKSECRVISPDRIISVPLSRQREWWRGFNQSEQLARRLSRWLKCSLDVGSLTRPRTIHLQKKLNVVERKKNVKGAFICSNRVDGQHILLVDDVVTTGNTIGEISRLLLQCGAKTVQVLCVCRTL